MSKLLLGLTLAFTAFAPFLQAAPLPTAFTYQGRLNTAGAPATGIYDLSFGLFDAETNGNLIGQVTNSATTVSNGLFTVGLDFGANAFDGTARWLQIAVRTNGTATFIPLTPRQPVTAGPSAIYALNAATATHVPAANITGTLPLAQLPPTVVTNNSTAVNLTGTFSGNGYALSNLNPSAIYRNPFVYPLGTIRNQMRDFASYVSADDNRMVTNFNLAGSGLIKSMIFNCVDSWGAIDINMQHLLLNIAYDGNPPITIPVAYLMGYVVDQTNTCYIATNGMVNVGTNNISTDFFEIYTYRAGDAHFRLKYPIPFTNGCTIWLSAINPGTRFAVASQIQYQELPDTWNRNLRFCVTNLMYNVGQWRDSYVGGVYGYNFGVNATNHPAILIARAPVFTPDTIGKWLQIIGGNGGIEVTDVLIVPPYIDSTNAYIYIGAVPNILTNLAIGQNYWCWASNVTFLDRPIGTSGYLAASFSSAANENLSANVHIFRNQEAVPSWEFSAIEDFYGGSWMFTQEVLFHTASAGLMYFNSVRPPGITPSSPYQFSAYRSFYDEPLFYSDGMRAMFNSTQAGWRFWHMVTVYYEFR